MQKFVGIFINSVGLTLLPNLHPPTCQGLVTSLDCEESFRLLKQRLISSPILAFPDYNLPFELHTDASGRALGYILMQRYPDDTTRVIAYGGRTLTKAEKNYTVTELELLALVDGCMKYAIYLTGREFTVYTDHANLLYLCNNDRLSARATRWVLKLSAFKMRIVHKPEAKAKCRS